MPVASAWIMASFRWSCKFLEILQTLNGKNEKSVRIWYSYRIILTNMTALLIAKGKIKLTESEQWNVQEIPLKHHLIDDVVGNGWMPIKNVCKWISIEIHLKSSLLLRLLILLFVKRIVFNLKWLKPTCNRMNVGGSLATIDTQKKFQRLCKFLHENCFFIIYFF